ncbi:MAG: murein biosynthesis integral membrane protein MurJ [Armatimonadota bacterium]
MAKPTPAPDAKPNLAGGVGRASAIVFVSLLLSRILGLVRDAVMAGKFGSDATTDAYRLAFQVPDLLFFLVAGGALSSAFIPVFSEYLNTDREEEAWKIFSVVATVMALVVLGFILFAGVFAEPLVHRFAPGKSPELVPLIALMSRIVLPTQFAFFIGGLMFGTLYAKGVYAVPGLGPNLYNLGIIFGAVALSTFFSPGVIGMSVGAVIGAVLGNLIVPLWAMRRIGARYRPSLDTSHPGVRKVFRLVLPVILGLSLPGVYGMIMQGFGSYFPDGTNTVLEFSNKLMQAPLGIFGQSMALAVFPVLTQHFALQRMDLYRDQLGATLRTVLFLGIPISALMFMLAPEIVATMYLHGKFTEAAALQTADCLRLFSVGVWAWCLHPVLMRGYYALQNTVAPILYGTATTVLFIGLLLTLWRTPLGYLALPFSSSICAILLVVAMIFGLSRKLGGIGIPRLVETGGKSTIAALAVVLIAAPVHLPAIHRAIWLHKGATLVVTLGVSLIAGSAYLLAAKALKMPETATLDRAFAKLRTKVGRAA